MENVEERHSQKIEESPEEVQTEVAKTKLAVIDLQAYRDGPEVSGASQPTELANEGTFNDDEEKRIDEELNQFNEQTEKELMEI